MTASMFVHEVARMAAISPLSLLVLIFGMVFALAGLAGVVCAVSFMLRTARRLPSRNEDLVLTEHPRREPRGLRS
ncbi:MAG: hypothetical protein QM772_04360 [Ottowia sp.]|uniref:hypothetical protein n=1 Tax=Ottowia sp. TaxID=1898956 RepID=UPI0039E68164